MDMEPEITVEDGEISSDEINYIPIVRPTKCKNTILKDNTNILEDGEINDDEVEYTPLERPLNFSGTCVPSLKTSDNDSEISSESESDSDSSVKKQKLKIKTKKLYKSPIKRKKYDIWSSHVQEDVLAETLISCDVSKIDRSRNVETYDVDMRGSGRRRGMKRSYEKRNNKYVSLKRKDNTDDEEIKGSERIILDLVTSVDNTNEEIAKDIANKLCEEKDDLILRIVQIAGKKKSIDLFNSTKNIEKNGGMLIMNQTRRRTPGGVFIFLLKRDDDITYDQQREIFSEERKEQIRERKANQKAKLKAIKVQMKAKKSSNDKILLSRVDLETQKVLSSKDRNESESEEFVNNPPPSPVTDGKENSSDGMSIPAYFLESGNVDMDVF